MPRRLRTAAGGFVYHVLNRAVGRATIFGKAGDYAAFVKVLRQAHEPIPYPFTGVEAPWPVRRIGLVKLVSSLGSQCRADLLSRCGSVGLQCSFGLPGPWDRNLASTKNRVGAVVGVLAPRG